MKRFIIAALLIVGLVTTFGASQVTAQSGLTEDQIQAIVSLVQSFGADTTVITSVENALRGRSDTAQQISDTVIKPTIATDTGALCKRILENRDVSIFSGIQSDAARDLQNFLLMQGYFDANATGYYGPITAGALCEWQFANGVVSSQDPSIGCGLFGPRTRERLTYVCEHGGGVPIPSEPSDGIGDGGGSLAPSPTPAPGFCTTEYAPVCGRVGSNAPQTYGNKCELNNAQATFLYSGECTDGSTIDGSNTRFIPDSSCKYWYDGCNECSRSFDGGPAICTLRACTQYSGGYCKASFVDTTTDLGDNTNIGFCTTEYAPICGQVGSDAPQTYSNKCVLSSAGASFLYNGECIDGNTGTTDIIFSGGVETESPTFQDAN